MARYCATDFARVVLYYLLFVAVVDTPARLRAMLVWLLAFIAAMTALALCQYHGVIDIPTLKSSSVRRRTRRRARSSSSFSWWGRGSSTTPTTSR